MNIRDFRSIIVIVLFATVNLVVIAVSYIKSAEEATLPKLGTAAPDFTEIQGLDYFFSKKGVPQISLAADSMKSEQDEKVEFVAPKGIYNYQKKNKTMRYQALKGFYRKDKQMVWLQDEGKVTSDDSEYFADDIKYYLDKDLIVGKGHVKFSGQDLKTGDEVNINSQKMRAYPEKQHSYFEEQVNGFIQRKKKYEGKTTFSSQKLEFSGLESLAHLEGDVRMTRDNYLITSGKADIFLENYNKSLKYFVLNDDVKVTETMTTPKGVTYRKAFSERLEGFGREEKMILSGAPRVEQGKDVIKGYRITIRENVDLIEIDDSMSDMEIKKKEKKEK